MENYCENGRDLGGSGGGLGFDGGMAPLMLVPNGSYLFPLVSPGGHTYRLGDIADVRRGYVDPPQQKMRWHGREALGLGITMAPGGDVIGRGCGCGLRDASPCS